MSVGLYVHFPFCSYLCNYCDYFKVLHLNNLEEKFFEALTTETKLVAKENPGGLKIDTLFIGGGTPSIAKLELLKDWLSVAREWFEFSEDLEFTIECNIDSVDVDKLSYYNELGITRPSFGAQSFHDNILDVLSRPHKAQISHQIIYHAHVLGYKSFNIDMLFGVPKQTGNIFSADIGQLIDMEPPHVSLYELSVEAETPMTESIENGELSLPDETMVTAMYSSAVKNLVENGYEHYEITSFAKPGSECRHSLNIWQGGDYLGLGPSANSYLNGNSFANIDSVGDYIKSLSDKRIPRTILETNPIAHADETIRSSLRLKQGINKEKFLERFGVALETRINKSELEQLIKNELLFDDHFTLKTTMSGFFKADEIARRLLK